MTLFANYPNNHQIVASSTGRKPFACGDIPDLPAAAPADDAVGRGRDAVRGFFALRSVGVLVLGLAVLLASPEAAHAAVPDAPTGLSATLTSTQASLSWSAPTNSNPAITGYQIEHSAWYAEDMVWGIWAVAVADTDSTSTTYSHTYSATLAPGGQLRYRVSAINVDGTGNPSNESEATVPNAPDTSGNGAPDRTGVNINGDRFIITFDEDLDDTKIPGPVFFTIRVNGSHLRVKTVEVSGSTVVGTLRGIQAVDSNDMVLIGYRLPDLLIGNKPILIADNALQDSEGNLVARWTYTQATNDTLPTASDGTVRTAPGTAYAFTAVDFNAYGDSLATVKIVTLPASDEGTLTLDGLDVSAGDSVTKADIDAGMLQYTPPAGASGIPYTTFTFKVSDGVKESALDYTMTIEVAPNSLPTASDGTVSTPPDTDYVFVAGDFNFADANSGDTLSDVRIVTLPSRGSLTLDGNNVTEDQVVTRADIDLGGLVFTPVAGEEGQSYTSFTFRVSDGAEESRSDYTMTINVSVAPVRSNAPPPPASPPPLAPDAPEVTQTEGGRTPGLDATWTEADNVHCPGGCPEITHYDLQYRRGGSGDWIDGLQEVTGTETTISVPDLMSPYQVRVRAVNAEGTEGPWSEPGVWSPPLEMASSRLMKAWLSRFGRTVADQVMDAVGARLQGPVGSPVEAGLQASIAGQSLGGAQGGTGATRAGVMDADDIEPEIHTRSLSGLDILRSSSFSYIDGDPGAGMMSVWGRGAVTGFDGRDEYDSGTVDVDGTVRSLMLGTDVRRASGVFGAVLTHSHGKGDYRDGPEEEGRIRSTLTGVYPYASHETGRLSLWGIMGYGKGEVTMHQDVSPYRKGTSVTTDMDLLMAAGGLRSELPGSTPDGMSVDAVADVMGVRVESDGVGKMLAAADAKVARMRAGLEGAWDAVEVGGGRMTPVARISFRHDGGDAEGGFGVDIEGRLHWSDPAQGVRMQLRGHGLLGHEADDFRERGISGSVSWDPEPESLRGAAFSLTSSVSEATTADVDYLLRNPGDHGVAARLSEDDDPDRDNRNSHQRVQAKVGYGIGIFGGRFTGIPELGVGWTDESRIYSLGWRLLKEGSNAGAIEMLLEATHREDTDDGESRDGIELRLKAYW